MYYSCGCSCSCGDDPCGCQQVVCTQCTTTTTTTLAPCIGEKCDELYDCACIIYNGPDLACYGIYNGDNLCRILEIAASNLPSCTITPPPTTTTTTCSCVGYNIVASKGGAVAYSYVACGTTKEIIEYLGKDPARSICTQRGTTVTIVAGNAVIYPLDPECCTITTVPEESTITRCTAETEYFGIENRWTDFPVSFKLISMKLNGTEYVTGTNPVLNINSSADLSIGAGLDNNPYVMNVSDWLSNLAIGSGFVFHDNMRVIDYPFSAASLYIEVEMTDNGGSQRYYYDSSQGYSYNGGLWYSYNCTLLT